MGVTEEQTRMDIHSPFITAPLLSDDEREMHSAEKEERERVDAAVHVMRGREIFTRTLFCDGRIDTFVSVTLPDVTPNRVQVRLCVMLNVRVDTLTLPPLTPITTVPEFKILKLFVAEETLVCGWNVSEYPDPMLIPVVSAERTLSLEYSTVYSVI